MTKLEKRINCIEYGQLLSISLGFQSQYSAYNQEHLVDIGSEYDLNESDQVNNVEEAREMDEQNVEQMWVEVIKVDTRNDIETDVEHPTNDQNEVVGTS